jgi:SAM-dependent methyltransferase
LFEKNIVEPEIVDDGEILSSIAEDSVDFVLANGFIELCQDPIVTLEKHLRVLKPNGILYLIVPDERFTFDRDRPVTSLEQLIRDNKEGPAVSVDSHFEEFTRLATKVPEDEVYEHARHLAETNFSIHYHVWTQVEFLELLLYSRSNLRLPFEIELLQKNDLEFICILTKEG